MSTPVDTTFVSGTTITSDWLNGVNDAVIDYSKSKSVSVKDAAFGAVGDGVTDDTAAIISALSYATSNLPCTVVFPTGIYAYTDIGNLAYSGLTLDGQGSVLLCTNTSIQHTAIRLDAFASGSPVDQFVQNCNLKNVFIKGNANTLRVIRAQGLARCLWENVAVANAESAAGIGFMFQGCSINTFINLICSTNYYPAMSPIPSIGTFLTNGFRAGVDIGQSTNNTFILSIMEGTAVGTNLNLADQNTFIGGTDESCTSYGTYANTTSRYNTFIGRGYENVGATADIDDRGISNKYINCYTLNDISLSGRNTEVDGGLHEGITVKAGALKVCVHDLIVNYIAGGKTFTDAGTATEWKNLYDQQAAAYMYPLAARTSISPTGSPFSWTNTTGQYVSVVMQTGTVSAVTMTRGGSTFIAPVAVPNMYLLAPTDTITFTYTVAPLLSYLPHNGFQG